MSDDAGREAWLVNMRAQMVVGYQGVDQAETGGPAAASAVLQPLPAFVDDILYIYMTYVYIYTYTYTYLHTFIYIYIYTINIYTLVRWSRFKCYACIP